MAKILLVDDDHDLRRLISLRLVSAGHQVVEACDAKQALAALESETVDVVLSDIRMPGMDGLQLFRLLRQDRPHLPVILLTAHASIPDAVAATQEGVFAYLTKPYQAEDLLEKVAEACQQSGSSQASDAKLEDELGLLSQSPLMQLLREQAKQVANTDISVVLRGESGTGKELLARFIHQQSQRVKGPFIAVNCGAIPEQLFESELFGHSKGAFSGASQANPGLVLSSNGGTLFLDEVAELPLAMQVKLLRVLQEQEVRAVGAVQAKSVSLRVIAASHQDLKQAVQQGQFREDLYYRLNVVELALPALRERREDIPVLARHFSQSFAERQGASEKHFSRDAMSCLISAKWPGNVRQLMNVVERTSALATTSIIDRQAVAQALDEVDLPGGLSAAKEQFERAYLAQLLRTTQGNVSQAALLAERNRTEFYKLLEKHQLSPVSFRQLAS